MVNRLVELTGFVLIVLAIAVVYAPLAVFVAGLVCIAYANAGTIKLPGRSKK